MTSAANLSCGAVDDEKDTGRMRAVMITGRNVPANVSTAEKPLKTTTGRVIVPGVHRNGNSYLNI